MGLHENLEKIREQEGITRSGYEDVTVTLGIVKIDWGTEGTLIEFTYKGDPYEGQVIARYVGCETSHESRKIYSGIKDEVLLERLDSFPSIVENGLYDLIDKKLEV